MWDVDCELDIFSMNVHNCGKVKQGSAERVMHTQQNPALLQYLCHWPWFAMMTHRDDEGWPSNGASFFFFCLPCVAAVTTEKAEAQRCRLMISLQ